MSRLPRVLMVGTGEYTTGFVGGGASTSDKSAGVVALTLFDLRARGEVGELFMAGTNGTKFPAIRAHLEQAIGLRYAGLDLSFNSFPGDDVERDHEAYRAALEKLDPGDVVTIFTPDDTHHEIARAAIEKGYHVLVAKPLVQKVADHEDLAALAVDKGLLCAMEVHKRWDPMYADARDRIRGELGRFSWFSSYMSQPKSQLETFRAWAGRTSDISYYLNAHHVDFLAWALDGIAEPASVVATASRGIAESMGLPAEDVISLTTEWRDVEDPSQLGTAVFTAAWTAPKSDVHSQQRFHYLGTEGEASIDQAHRGYGVATDDGGFASPNPLFMKYVPDSEGRFAGQGGYGYRSIADFLAAARSVNAGETTPRDWNDRLATGEKTVAVTAILEAGRRSLDEGGARIAL